MSSHADVISALHYVGLAADVLAQLGPETNLLPVRFLFLEEFLEVRKSTGLIRSTKIHQILDGLFGAHSAEALEDGLGLFTIAFADYGGEEKFMHD